MDEFDPLEDNGRPAFSRRGKQAIAVILAIAAVAGGIGALFGPFDIFSPGPLPTPKSPSELTPTPSRTVAPSAEATITFTPILTPTAEADQSTDFDCELLAGRMIFDADVVDDAWETINDPTLYEKWNTVVVEFDAHGEVLGTGNLDDESAIALEVQGGTWRYVALANYRIPNQPRPPGLETAVIPMSDFRFLEGDLVSSLHVRMWFGRQFHVEIISIRVCNE